jgi:hypothetical protein
MAKDFMADQKEKTPVEIQAEYEAEQKRVKELAMGLLPPEAADVVRHAKSMGVQPYTVQIGDQWFIYRVINRMEYTKLLVDQAEPAQKLIQQAENDLAGRITVNLRNEERLVIKCLLYPRLDEISVKETPAGWIDALNTAIMNTSGFNAEPVPIKL